MFGFFEKRILIYSCFGYQDYLKTVAKLASAGISYRTKTRTNNRGMGRMPMSINDRTAQYDIYVKKEDKLKANDAIHHARH